MGLGYDKLIFCEKVFFVMSLSVILFMLCICGGMQQMSYCYYKINEEQYQIVEAVVMETNEIPVTFRGYEEPFVAITEMQISYIANNRNYVKKIYLYDDKKEYKTIVIAINKNNADKVKRCIPYTAIKDNYINIILRAGKVLGIAVSIFVLLNLFILYRRKKDNEQLLQNMNEKLRKDEEGKRTESFEKQELIKSYCSKNNAKILSNEKIMEIMKKLEIAFSDDYIWCLTNLAEQECFYPILLLEKKEGGEYEFERITLQLREQGLPHNYYIIAKNNGNYLCGCEKVSRIFCFSVSLGITNTQYATIYDYILKRWKELQ